jgi:hypothetical protein
MSEYDEDDEELDEILEDDADVFLDTPEEDDQIVLTEEEALLKADELCAQTSLYDFYIEEMSK